MSFKEKILLFFDQIHQLIQKEIKVLLVVFVMVTCTWLFFVIANAVSSGWTQQADESILNSLRDKNNIKLPVGPSWLQEFMGDITSFGGGTAIFIITTIVVIYLILQKEYSDMWFILGATIGGTLISFGLKELFPRERPNEIFRLITVSSLSFPSGHSMMSAVIYLTEASLLARIQKIRKIRIYIISVAITLTFLIGFSRVYLGVHYPTDVIGGWSVGSAWASFCWFIAWYIQRRSKRKIPVSKK